MSIFTSHTDIAPRSQAGIILLIEDYVNLDRPDRFKLVPDYDLRAR